MKGVWEGEVGIHLGGFEGVFCGGVGGRFGSVVWISRTIEVGAFLGGLEGLQGGNWVSYSCGGLG